MEMYHMLYRKRRFYEGQWECFVLSEGLLLLYNLYAFRLIFIFAFGARITGLQLKYMNFIRIAPPDT